ncbi:hypothetical protein Micbo1qcDRAFT_18230 [Microdochium bolleyi]|uniref:Uncharacterized protein n=1 Tax=Microdochium bolleyi TaxID=196109 RepID=A0A136IUT0_9PEZI|nr:hypothetical protein Micbo1qcDRAFT_18230 [Microdochium bolleyi]
MPYMSADLAVSLRDDEPWHVSQKVFDIISTYIQNDDQSDPAESAKELDKLTPGNRALQEIEPVESYLSFLLEFWEVFLKIARQVPHDHPAQNQLVRLVVELKGLPTTDVESDRTIWTDLDGLENCTQESWMAPSANEDSFEPLKEWVNLNSTVSRLYGIGLIDWYYFGIWTLRDSFETNDFNVSGEDILNSRVTASGEWMRHSGPQLRQICERAALTASEQTS